MVDQSNEEPFGIFPENRVVVVIDGPSIYSATRQLGYSIDYNSMLAHFKNESNLVRAYYYTPLNLEEEENPLRRILDYLDYNGYSVFTKPIKDYSDDEGRRRERGSIAVELVVTTLDLIQRPNSRIDKMFLFSGDGNYTEFVRAVQRNGVNVTVVSTKGNKNGAPSMVADELRRIADNFVDLSDLMKDNLFYRARADN